MLTVFIIVDPIHWTLLLFSNVDIIGNIITSILTDIDDITISFSLLLFLLWYSLFIDCWCDYSHSPFIVDSPIIDCCYSYLFIHWVGYWWYLFIVIDYHSVDIIVRYLLVFYWHSDSPLLCCCWYCCVQACSVLPFIHCIRLIRWLWWPCCTIPRCYGIVDDPHLFDDLIVDTDWLFPLLCVWHCCVLLWPTGDWLFHYCWPTFHWYYDDYSIVLLCWYLLVLRWFIIIAVFYLFPVLFDPFDILTWLFHLYYSILFWWWHWLIHCVVFYSYYLLTVYWLTFIRWPDIILIHYLLWLFYCYCYYSIFHLCSVLTTWLVLFCWYLFIVVCWYIDVFQ